MGNFYDKGVDFNCTECGYCCGNEPGFVFLSQKDLSNLAKAANLSEKEFLSTYCTVVDLGFTKRVSLIEKDNGNHDCILLDDKRGCSLYEARPFQCRSYPFWSSIMESQKSWDEEKKYCSGLDRKGGKRFSKKEIDKWLLDRSEDPLLTVN